MPLQPNWRPHAHALANARAYGRGLWGGLPLALLLCVTLAMAVHAVRFKMRYPKMEPEVHDTTQNAERGYTWFTDRRHRFTPIVDSGPPHRCEIVAAEVRPHKTDDAAGGGGAAGGEAAAEGGGDAGGSGGDAEAAFVEFATQLQAKLRDDEGGSGGEGEGGAGEGEGGADGKEDMSSLMGALQHVGHFTGLRGAFADGEKGARAWLKHPKRVEKKHPGKHFWSCVDARSTYAVLGTPGGDVGEFILALGAAELANPKHHYTLEEVNQLFQEFMYRMQAFGKHHLYLHTDEAAEKALAAAAGAKNAKRPASAEERNALIDACVQPEHIGCQHLKAMVGDSSGYKIRKELVEYVLKVYHSVYYDTFNPLHKHLLYVTLKGEAAKTPGFKVFTPHVCHRHEAPVLVPDTAGDDADGGRYAKRGADGKAKPRPGSKAWVHHHRHVKYWRNVLGAFLVLHDGHLSMPEIANRQDWIAAQHEKKLEAVYGGPAYDLIFG